MDNTKSERQGMHKIMCDVALEISHRSDDPHVREGGLLVVLESDIAEASHNIVALILSAGPENFDAETGTAARKMYQRILTELVLFAHSHNINVETRDYSWVNDDAAGPGDC